MRAADFEAQLLQLKKLGFQSVPLSTFAQYYFTGDETDLPQYMVTFTFDDGYIDNYCIDAPLLLKYGFTGTFFVPTAYVGSDKILPHDAMKGGSNETDKIMTWQQANELLSQGMEIGGHTMNHTVLTEVDKGTAWTEISGCMEQLREHLGDRQYYFCYPRNMFDREIVEMVQNAGFVGAVLTPNFTRHVPYRDPYLIRRVGIQRQNSLYVFQLKVFGWYDIFRDTWWWQYYKRSHSGFYSKRNPRRSLRG